MPEDVQGRIGAFLRRKRESLAPEIAGLSRTPRARTPGLRREDVADMAGISTVWYAKIERGKAYGISREVIAALTAALRLDETERQYVMTLAGLDTAPVRDPCLHVNNDTLRLIRRLDPLPAIVINDYFDIIATNRAYEPMCGRYLAAQPQTERNYIALMLTDPAWQRFLQMEDESVREGRLLRLVGARRPDGRTMGRSRRGSTVCAHCRRPSSGHGTARWSRSRKRCCSPSHTPWHDRWFSGSRSGLTATAKPPAASTSTIRRTKPTSHASPRAPHPTSPRKPRRARRGAGFLPFQTSELFS